MLSIQLRTLLIELHDKPETDIDRLRAGMLPDDELEAIIAQQPTWFDIIELNGMIDTIRLTREGNEAAKQLAADESRTCFMVDGGSRDVDQVR